MDILGKLQELGWYLTEAGLNKILSLTNNDKSVKRIIDVALDMDLREIGGGALPSGKRDDKIKGNIVLQVLKVRNIAAPKANETSKVAPRMLLLELTDGTSSITSVEMHNIPLLSLSLPPGKKIHIKSGNYKCVAGYLMLHCTDMTILGGRVENLEEKWEIARSISEFTRSGIRTCGDTAPPSWVPFGKKTQANKLLDAKNFKSLQITANNSSNNNPKKGENESFNNFRSEAIAEATKQGGKKVFSGGGQQIVDHNIKKITDKGYSEDEAKRALAQTNNNLERAFSNLKRATTTTASTSSSNPLSTNRYNNRNNNNNNNYNNHNDESSTKLEISKPSGNVTLSEFLADKLPTRKVVENSDKFETKEVVKTNPFKSYAAIENNQNSTGNSNSSNTYDNRQTHKPSQMNNNNNEHKSNNNINNTNRIQQRNQSHSKTKFENNMSSSFAANQRGTPNNGSGNYQYRQRTEYNGSQNYNSNNREPSMNKQHDSRLEQQNTVNGRGNVDKTMRSNNRTNYNNNNNNNNNNSNTYGRTFNSNRYTAGRENSYEKTMNSNVEGENNNNSYHNRRDRERNNNVVSTTNNRPPQKSYNKANQEMQPQVENSSNKQNSMINNNNQNINQNQNKRNEPRKVHSNSNGIKGESNSENTNFVGMVFSSKSSNVKRGCNTQEQQCWPAGQTKLQNSTKSSKRFETENLPYDSSKIIGFQSKETNERAMNLLKSEGVTIKTLPHLDKQKQPLSNSVIKSQQKTTPAAPEKEHQNNVEVQQHLTGGFKNNSSQSYYPNKTSTISSVFTPSKDSDNYGMIPNEAWTWKVGDVCLAKYWDDGCYYEAEITAISEKTFVVYFLGYGNHEEVLKSDCLPITDANHKSINFNKNIDSLSKHESHSTGYDNRSGNYEGNQRHRSERQVYVPPPKRSEN